MEPLAFQAHEVEAWELTWFICLPHYTHIHLITSSFLILSFPLYHLVQSTYYLNSHGSPQWAALLLVSSLHNTAAGRIALMLKSGHVSSHLKFPSDPPLSTRKDPHSFDRQDPPAHISRLTSHHFSNHSFCSSNTELETRTASVPLLTLFPLLPTLRMYYPHSLLHFYPFFKFQLKFIYSRQ